MVAVRIPSRHRPEIVVGPTGGMHRRLVGKLTALVRHEARQLLLPLAALTAVSSLGTLAAPGLIAGDQSLLLVALSPRLSFLAIAAPQTALVPFLVVAGLRLCLADPFHFFLGRRHGSGAVARLAGRHRWLATATTIAARSIPVLVFLRPNGTNLAIAGASRHSALQVAVADIVGTVAYLLLIHQVGAHVVSS